MKGHLLARLPEYMAPSVIIKLDRIPLTAHGKLDRRALAGVEGDRPELAEVYARPVTPTEAALAEVWSDVLGVDRVGVDDQFFALGGDSILSVRLIALAKQKGLNLSLQDLFKYQTIRSLARRVEINGMPHKERAALRPFHLISEEDQAKLPQDVEDAYPLASLQAGMIYHMELTPEFPVYHNVNSFLLRVALDVEVFREAVRRVVRRHPVLRTSFDLTSYSQPIQLVHRSADLVVEVDDIRHLTFDECEQTIDEYMASESENRFDLSSPPLLRLHLHRRADDLVQMTITECHAIIDGWSLHATLTEVFTLYDALSKGAIIPEDKWVGSSFGEFVQMEVDEQNSREAREFWWNTLKGFTATELPATAAVAQQTGPRVRRRNVGVSDDLFQRLNSIALEAGAPVKSVILAAHIKALSMMTGQNDLVLG
ncbi:MAG: condensation domain-containing protein, partial [Blastocatellia bacterium]